MTDYTTLAAAVYSYAEGQYNAKGARFDVIVETMGKAEIEQELRDIKADTILKAKKWADRFARMQHEVELNQAWDGPESVPSSEKYERRFDPHGEY